MRRSFCLLLLVLAAALAPAQAAARSLAATKEVVRIALRERGVRYRWGGTSPASGFDCSGFTRWVFAHVGVGLPHSSFAQIDYGRRVWLGALRPGDLLFFSGLGHVGIYVGGGRFVHAPRSGTVVSVDRLAGWPLVAARRL